MPSLSPTPAGSSTEIDTWKKRWLTYTGKLIQLTDQNVGGWFFPQEAGILLQLSACLPKGSRVVEIGSFMGKSTRYLAAGTLFSGSSLTCIDPFESSGEGEPEEMQKFYRQIAPAGTMSLFTFNLRQIFPNEDLDHVEMIVKPSLKAAKGWGDFKPIDLLFIDGNHKEAYDDFRAWLPHMAPWGLVALHDTHCGGIYGTNGPDNTVFYACQQHGCHVFAGADTLTILTRGKQEPGNEAHEFWRTRLEAFTGERIPRPDTPAGTVPPPDGQPGSGDPTPPERGPQG